ncbi:TPA: hypothetical protein ACMEW7_004245 [Klebsiella pneumoniae]|uniref:hypothetical protein n=1 Tax=Klebsiella pneumoniae complex TaxID=3390273 RepID=UPI0009C929EC|nr:MULTISPECIES: hypothetical protein [Klebsiella]MBP3167093.1 hypothetical protein [Klebsiella pneumoniae]MBP3172506.1 hypothetical protein [Klebsiella pneumoniae]MBP3183648.1 hypothetical protein [Klebsiella pneumoniae]MCI8097253.1 hypothetical protein [Klebsiella pneumoniae]MDO1521900.1 hypothetical protein [Klebsiella variicola]
MTVISSNIKLSALLLFALLSNSACAQEKYNSVLSLPMTLPGEEILDPSLPKISDWYQSCKRAEDTKNARDWGYCKGYLDSAIQSHYETTKKRCPNLSIQNFLDAVEKEASVYQEHNSIPAKGRDGKAMNGVRVYKKNTLTEWQRPAFSVLSGIIKKECTL